MRWRLEPALLSAGFGDLVSSGRGTSSGQSQLVYQLIIISFLFRCWLARIGLPIKPREGLELNAGLRKLAHRDFHWIETAQKFATFFDYFYDNFYDNFMITFIRVYIVNILYIEAN